MKLLHQVQFLGLIHARIKKVLSEGSKFDNVFLVDEGIKDKNTAINRSSSALHLNGISL